MNPTAHTIDIEDDGRIKLTITVDNRQNFSFVFTHGQAMQLAQDIFTSLEDDGEPEDETEA